MTATTRGKRSRGNNEGTIYRRESDARWCAELTLDGGKRKVLYGRTRDEVARKLRAAQNDREEGTLTTGSMTLDRFAPQYLAAVKLRNVRPRTLEAYREKLDLHILPALGKARLDRITAARIEQLYIDKLERGLSPGTIGMIHQVLNQVFRLAKRRRLVGRVVTEDVDPPKRQKHQARPLSVSEAKALLAAIREHRHGPLWTFMLATGVRFGEAVGLTWSSVDLETGTAQIHQAVTRHRLDGKVKLAIDAVKTDAGNRVLALPDWTVAALKAQRARVVEMRLAAGSAWLDRDLVFPNKQGGPLAENHVLVTWHRALKAAGLPKIRMHDLRHTKGTLMADEGEDTVVIQRTLGHARQSITADLYIGQVPKALRSAADRFGALLGPDPAPDTKDAAG